MLDRVHISLLFAELFLIWCTIKYFESSIYMPSFCLFFYSFVEFNNLSILHIRIMFIIRNRVPHRPDITEDGLSYLPVDAVDLSVLVLELGAHINRHVAQVADHGVHLAHVVLHLILARVVRYPGIPCNSTYNNRWVTKIPCNSKNNNWCVTRIPCSSTYNNCWVTTTPYISIDNT